MEKKITFYVFDLLNFLSEIVRTDIGILRIRNSLRVVQTLLGLTKGSV